MFPDEFYTTDDVIVAQDEDDEDYDPFLFGMTPEEGQEEGDDDLDEEDQDD